MKRSTEITNLGTVRARNLLRGMIANPEPAHALKALEKIRSTCSEADFRKTLLILRGNQVFRQNAFGRDFNREFPRLIKGAAGTTFSSNDILEKIEDANERILGLLNLTRNILELISDRKFLDAVLECRKLFKEQGASIAGLRYLHFIRNRVITDQNRVKEIDDVLNSASVENVKYIATVSRELSSSKTDYFNIADRIGKADWTLSVAIARTFVDIIPRSPDEYFDALNGFYSVSLFDAFLYIARLQVLELPFVPRLTESLYTPFASINKIQFNANGLFTDDETAAGFDLFRESFLLIEVDAIFLYRIAHGALFNASERKEDVRIAYERRVLSRYFADLTDIAEIGSQSCSRSCRIDRYEKTAACQFQNSTALVYLLERSDGDIHGKEVDFVRLMSRTRDIGTICPQQYIEKIKINAQTAELRIVASSLSHIKQRSQLKEHELRAVLQAAASEAFSGNYTALLDHVFAISPAVAEHLVQFSDETFLSKLFQIMGSPNAAIEERASILEWYGNKIADAAYLDRAKNLRIDVQISKERGTIDDSRIYVDPVKYIQWINNQVLDKFAILLESLPQPVEAVLVPLVWDKVKTGITTYDQLGSLIVQCYEEFCSNKVYGIASYLGRRIRHGTLKGTGYNDIAQYQSNSRFAKLFEIHEFNQSYLSWLRDYEDRS